jgi:IS4 transposase
VNFEKSALTQLVAMDRTYTDFELMNKWNVKGIFFVTRMKNNAVCKVVSRREVPKNRNILSRENKKEIVLLTNHLEFGATTISSIYKERWEIELFFKALKQNLKVKTFIGTSRNALLIQIWTALLALVVLKWLHYLSKAGWSFSNMAVMTRLNLFTYRNLREWLDEPYATPPVIPEPEQLSLAWK